MEDVGVSELKGPSLSSDAHIRRPNETTLSPIWKLPHEMFCSILRCLVEDGVFHRGDIWIHPLHDFYAAMRVCRLWRELSLHSTVLWSYIDMTWNDFLYELCLERSGPEQNFHLSCWDMGPLHGRYDRFIKAYHQRIRAITLAGPYGVEDLGVMCSAAGIRLYWDSFQSCSFPILESLVIDCPFDRTDGQLVAEEQIPRILCHNPDNLGLPYLRSLRVGWYSSWDVDNFTNLVEFYWDSPAFWLALPRLSHFMAFLANNSASLQRITLVEPHFDNDIQGTKVLTLPSLRSFIVDKAEMEVVTCLVDRLGIPDQAELCLARIVMSMNALDINTPKLLRYLQVASQPSPQHLHSLCLSLGSNPSGSHERYWARFHQTGFGARYYSAFVDAESPLSFKTLFPEFMKAQTTEVSERVTELIFSFQSLTQEQREDEFTLPPPAETRDVLRRFRNVERLTYAGPGGSDVLCAIVGSLDDEGTVLATVGEIVCPELRQIRITVQEATRPEVQRLVALCQRRGCQVELMAEDEYIGIPTSRVLPFRIKTYTVFWGRPPNDPPPSSQ